MTPESLRQTVAEFLAGARAAVVVEDGAVVFDLAESKYSISGEYNKCLLQLWSSERNVVRRVLDAEVKGGSLRLLVQRMGQSHPTKLEICRDRDRRSPSSRKVARSGYEHRLRRILERRFPDWRVVRLMTSMDLEHSFGPAYARGLMWRGQSALAVVGVDRAGNAGDGGCGAYGGNPVAGRLPAPATGPCGGSPRYTSWAPRSRPCSGPARTSPVSPE